VVTAESAPGRGTTIRVFLPRVPEPARAGGNFLPETAAEPPARLRHASILLVEDDEGVRRLTRRVLEQYGFQAVEARGGEEALDLLRNDEPRIDAIVTDVVMPGMSGTELVERVREERPEIPVVYLSGYTGEEVSEQVRNHHKQVFLQKPFSPDALAAALEDLLADVIPPATAG
jgi:CheY-like chemotaxis protein